MKMGPAAGQRCCSWRLRGLQAKYREHHLKTKQNQQRCRCGFESSVLLLKSSFDGWDLYPGRESCGVAPCGPREQRGPRAAESTAGAAGGLFHDPDVTHSDTSA